MAFDHPPLFSSRALNSRRSSFLSLPNLLRIFLVVSALSSSAFAQRPNRPAATSDPFADPKNDVYNPLRYIPNNALTTVAVVLILLVAIIQTIWIFKWGAKWMLAMTIGAYCFALGIAFRYGLHTNPRSQGIYIAEYLFVTLSPCGFIAADYVLLGRLAVYLKADKHLLVSSRRLTLVFVMSDVATFLTQAAGGALTTSRNNPNNLIIGPKIFLAGLAAQLASFAAFSAVYAIFLWRVYTKEKQTWTVDDQKPWYSRWTTLAAALVLSCIGILVRSCFRTAELSEGFGGPLSRDEGMFYGLDTLPLFIAIAVYVPLWPGRFIRDGQSGVAGSGHEMGNIALAEPKRGSSESGVGGTMVEVAQSKEKV